MQPLVERSPPAAGLYYGTFGVWLGLLLIVAGLTLALGSWLSCLVATVLATAGVARRIAVEESALASHLGPEWTAFARTRKRLIPMVW